MFIRTIDRMVFEALQQRGEFNHLGKPVAVVRGVLSERRQYKDALIIVRENSSVDQREESQEARIHPIDSYY